MAQIWCKSDAGNWQAVSLAADSCALAASGPSALAGESDAPAPSALLRRVAVAGEDTWALLTSTSARLLLNGLPTKHGIAILADRDEIRWPATEGASAPPAAPLFFSTECLPTVVRYPADGRRGSCPRCKQTLAAGIEAVRCPGCGLWHHATEALPCWTYGERCAACSQHTSLEAGFRWTPEEL